MRRSKELYEYLRQHGMYTQKGGEAGDTQVDEIEGACSGPSAEADLEEAGDVAPEPVYEAPIAERQGPASGRGDASKPGKGSRWRESFGDKTFAISYNNVAVCLLFAVALLVLSYFLGFSQGVGDFSEHEYRIQMNQASPDPGSFDSRASGVPESQDPGPEGTALSGAEEPEHGFLEDQKIYWAVRVYTANAGNILVVRDHVNNLKKKNYDAWTRQKNGKIMLYVGRYDNQVSEELLELLDDLRNWKLQYDDDEVILPFKDAFIDRIGP